MIWQVLAQYLIWRGSSSVGLAGVDTAAEAVVLFKLGFLNLIGQHVEVVDWARGGLKLLLLASFDFCTSRRKPTLSCKYRAKEWSVRFMPIYIPNNSSVAFKTVATRTLVRKTLIPFRRVILFGLHQLPLLRLSSSLSHDLLKISLSGRLDVDFCNLTFYWLCFRQRLHIVVSKISFTRLTNFFLWHFFSCKRLLFGQNHLVIGAVEHTLFGCRSIGCWRQHSLYSWLWLRLSKTVIILETLIHWRF